MSQPTNDSKSISARRDFLKSAGAAAAGVYLAGAGSLPTAHAAEKSETLALNGGPRAVTYPPAKRAACLRWPPYGDAEKEALKAALDTSSFYKFNAELEAKWHKYNDVPFCKTHMNGTSAFMTMFSALGYPVGTEIMVPSYTFFGAIIPMRFFGYVPVFVDINPRTATLDVEHAKRVITPKTKAIMAMHSWGLPCEMDHINDFAKERGIDVLEDCAHAHGASIQGKKVGNWSRMAAYSFQGTKVLPGIEGGMGIYQKREDYERATALGHYEACGTLFSGSPDFPNAAFSKDSPYLKYTGTGLGLKLRMHPLAAVLIMKQLEGLDQRNAVIRNQVRTLNDRVCQLPGLSEPACRPDQERVYYNHNMLFFDAKKAGMSRQNVVKALAAEGVSANEGSYPENHKCPIYSEPQWWHHPVDVPKVLSGCKEVNARGIFIGLLRHEAPELVEQYAKAFEKVWAHQKDLA